MILSRFPWLRHRDRIGSRTAEECGRSAAHQGRKVELGPPSSLARRPLRESAGLADAPAGSGQKLPRFCGSPGPVLRLGWLTIMQVEDYIDPLGRAAASRDGASAKPLTVHTVTEHPAMLFMAMFASPRRMCGFSRLRRSPEPVIGRRSREVPGCLKSESEERETWTAESLRAAFAIGATLSRKRS
jgi:hypothetical protein